MRKTTVAVLIALLVLVAVLFGAVYVYINHSDQTASDETEKPVEVQLPESDTSVTAETEQTETETAAQEVPETAIPLIGAGKKVCIDPGHQSELVDMTASEPNGPGSSTMKMKATTGTTGRFTQVPEYELNLAIAKLLSTELEARGYEVILTREDHTTAISNKERAELATSVGADIFVRIHANGSDDPSEHGAFTMVPSSNNPYVADLAESSYVLGECIIQAYCAATGLENRGVQTFDDQTGINWSTVPVTIIEMGYMSNQSDDEYMQKPESQAAMARGIADGIDQYFIKTSPQDDQTPMADLRQKMEDYLQKHISPNERWSIGIYQCDTKLMLACNNQRQQAASLIKLFIMGAVYEQYDALVTKHGQNQIDQLLNSMITISDNDAANSLTRMLGDGDEVKGREVVNSFCSAHGFTETTMGRMLLAPKDQGDNITSVSDVTAFMSQVQAHTLTGAEQMEATLKKQQRTSKIPAGVPEGVVTANKTGELSDVENDTAIIYAKHGTYILTVMAESLSNPGNARAAITGLSELVYAYMENQ